LKRTELGKQQSPSGRPTKTQGELSWIVSISTNHFIVNVFETTLSHTRSVVAGQQRVADHDTIADHDTVGDHDAVAKEQTRIQEE